MTNTIMNKRTAMEDKSDSQYTVQLRLRLSPEQYDELVLNAQAAGCSISEEARILMFKKASEAMDFKRRVVTPKDMERYKLSALETIKKEFKRIAGAYVRMTNSIINGNPHSPANILRKLSSIEQMTVESQRYLNAILAVLNAEEIDVLQREMSKVNPPNGIKSVDENKQKNENSLYEDRRFNRVKVIGVITSDAKEHEKNGVKRMVFKVVYQSKNKKNCVSYTVLSDLSETIDSLKKDCVVFVEGDFIEHEKWGNLIITTPNNIHIVAKNS